MKSFFRNNHILITGANGFLGSHLTKALIARGSRPCVLRYEENPGSIFDEEQLTDATNTIRGDIRNLHLLQNIIRTYRIDTIFHLAAQPIVDQAIDDPITTFEVNIQGTWNILEAAKNIGGVKRLIIASSDKAYGHHDQLPYHEDTHDLRGAYPYEVSKACADLISQSICRTFDLPICITRCTNLYGPGDLKFNRVVPQTIKKLHYGEPPVMRDTGESLRDYLFISDAVDGYLRLAETMQHGMFGAAFNFSTNRPLPVAEVIRIIGREMGTAIEADLVHTKGYEIRHQYASYEKAKRILGWEPTHTFIEGIQKTIPWYRAYFQKYGASQ